MLYYSSLILITSATITTPVCIFDWKINLFAIGKIIPYTSHQSFPLYEEFNIETNILRPVCQIVCEIKCFSISTSGFGNGNLANKI